MDIQFTSRLIKANADKKTNYGYRLIGLGIIGAIAFGAFKMYNIATISFSISIATIIYILIAKKGNVAAFYVSGEKFIMTPNDIQIAQQTFPVNKISALTLTIHSFSGMDFADGSTSNGMTNNISFTFNGKEHYHWFYLANRNHTVELCAVLREYYRARVPVVERDYKRRRTWLMQLLETKEEIETFKARHKIP